ncbi:MAG: hypothetical protein RL300_692 [Pseudomonadota bacterium]
MTTSQRKPGHGMIEARALPGLVVVTSAAIGAQLSFVFVVFFMARQTGLVGMAHVGQVLMA